MAALTVCRFSELADGAATKVEVDGVAGGVALVRIGDAVHAVGDRCTHADVSLSEGDVDVDTCHLECWRHGSSFSLLTGEPNALPATRPVTVYAVEVNGDDVVLTVPDAEEVPS